MCSPAMTILTSAVENLPPVDDVISLDDVEVVEVGRGQARMVLEDANLISHFELVRHTLGAGVHHFAVLLRKDLQMNMRMEPFAIVILENNSHIHIVGNMNGSKVFREGKSTGVGDKMACIGLVRHNAGEDGQGAIGDTAAADHNLRVVVERVVSRPDFIDTVKIFYNGHGWSRADADHRKGIPFGSHPLTEFHHH